MKKTNLILLTSTMLLSVFATSGCSSGKIKIGILQPVEHPALSEARLGFIEGLRAQGYDESKVEFVYRNAGGKEADQNAMAKDLISSCSLSLGIATGASQALKSASIDKGSINPVLFTAVTDPVDAGLVESLQVGKGFVTGTSDAQPIKSQVALIKECIPDADKVGILYTQTETNSVKQAEQAEQAIKDAGMSVVTKTATSAADVSATALALASVDGIDAIYIPTDNNIAANADAVKTAVHGKGILVVPGEEGILKGCGAVTLSISYFNLGKATGEMAATILKGEKTAAQIPVGTVSEKECEYVMSSVNIADSGANVPQSVREKCRDVSK